MEEGEPATIDPQSVQVNVNPARPSSYSKATGNGLSNAHDPPIQTKSIYFDNRSSSVRVAMPDITNPVSIVAPKPDPSQKPKDFVMFSCFVILCCNFIFGFLGYNYGVKSNHAWQIGEINQARKRARVALLFDIVGILCGVATWVLAFTLYFACEPCNPFSMRLE